MGARAGAKGAWLALILLSAVYTLTCNMHHIYSTGRPRRYARPRLCAAKMMTELVWS
jgi:hypothetical protein